MNRPTTISTIRTLLVCLVLICALSATGCQSGDANGQPESNPAAKETAAETSSDVVSTMDAEAGEIVFDTSGELPAKKPAADSAPNSEDSDSGSDG